jgi:hypothetical protein
MQNKSAAPILALHGQMKNQSSGRIHNGLALYMYGRAIVDDKQAFKMGRTIKDDKQPSRMIKIQHPRHGAWPLNWKHGTWWTFVPSGNYIKGRSKVGRKERFKKNVIALFLSLSLYVASKHLSWFCIKPKQNFVNCHVQEQK